MDVILPSVPSVHSFALSLALHFTHFCPLPCHRFGHWWTWFGTLAKCASKSVIICTSTSSASSHVLRPLPKSIVIIIIRRAERRIGREPDHGEQVPVAAAVGRPLQMVGHTDLTICVKKVGNRYTESYISPKSNTIRLTQTNIVQRSGVYVPVSKQNCPLLSSSPLFDRSVFMCTGVIQRLEFGAPLHSECFCGRGKHSSTRSNLRPMYTCMREAGGWENLEIRCGNKRAAIWSERKFLEKMFGLYACLPPEVSSQKVRTLFVYFLCLFVRLSVCAFYSQSALFILFLR